MGLAPVVNDTVEPAPGLGAGCGSHIGQRAAGVVSGGRTGRSGGGNGISSERHLLSALFPLCSYANVITYSRQVQRGRPAATTATTTTRSHSVCQG